MESFRYVESDAKLIERVLGREIGGKGNILIMNDEAHHAYRIRRPEPDEDEEDLFGEEDDGEEFYREATVWVDGLDRIHKHRDINLCVDLSATPYYLGRVGEDASRPFPWVVSDFGLVDAIESGLVKIPQLAVRDTSGSTVPGYFNIWRWILPKLTPAERGGRRATVKPEAVLKYAHVPLAMLGGLWDALREEWEQREDESRPPVFIIVCKNTALARVIYRWLAEDDAPVGIPPARLDELRNVNADMRTIRVDSKVVRESDGGESKSNADRWMRLTLDTVGKTDWPRDRQGRPLYPEGFEALARKLERPLHPPGRDVRCIVSVGMLTEGMGLQHRHPHHRAPTVHVAVALRTGRRPRAAPIQLRSGRGWQARRGGREDLRRSVRDRAAKGEFPSQRAEAGTEDLAHSGRARESASGDSFPTYRGLHASAFGIG